MCHGFNSELLKYPGKELIPSCGPTSYTQIWGVPKMMKFCSETPSDHGIKMDGYFVENPIHPKIIIF
jgi:hypothetical protein